MATKKDGAAPSVPRKPKAPSLYALVKVEKVLSISEDDAALAEQVTSLPDGIYAVTLAKRVIAAKSVRVVAQADIEIVTE